ncbi:MAG: HPr family phosphocarrier protein [Gammaproteobacteria bacterium]|nr:HPr family phosphocarrier protein [Gammaproteobacteria bacterium]
MLQQTVTIKNKLGLHARASAKFVSTALRFQSQLELVKGEQVVNGKSIMAVMMLGAAQGVALTLKINGVDEEAMQTALVKLIEDRFGEPD